MKQCGDVQKPINTILQEDNEILRFYYPINNTISQ